MSRRWPILVLIIAILFALTPSPASAAPALFPATRGDVSDPRADIVNVSLDQDAALLTIGAQFASLGVATATAGVATPAASVLEATIDGNDDGAFDYYLDLVRSADGTGTVKASALRDPKIRCDGTFTQDLASRWVYMSVLKDCLPATAPYRVGLTFILNLGPTAPSVVDTVRTFPSKGGAVPLPPPAAPAPPTTTPTPTSTPGGNASPEVNATVVNAPLRTSQVAVKPKGVQAKTSGAIHAVVSDRSLTWLVTLDGLTGKALSITLRQGKPKVAGPTVATLCRNCGKSSAGRVTLSKQTLAALKAGRLYVEVVTAKNRAGELRGQLRPQ